LRESVWYFPEGLVYFDVSVTVHSEVSLSDQPLTKMIENAASDSDLLDLANEDLSKVVVKMKGKRAGVEITLQDKLVTSRMGVVDSRPITSNKRGPK